MNIRNLTRKILLKTARGFSNFNLTGLANALNNEALKLGSIENSYTLIARNHLRNKKYREAAVVYKIMVKLAPNNLSIFELGNFLGASKDGLKSELYSALVNLVETAELREMLVSLSKTPEIYQPSKFWINYMIYNIYQIEACGIENFKRSVNNNYHNFIYESGNNPIYRSAKKVLGWSDEDIKNAEKNIGLPKVEKPTEFTEMDWKYYTQFLIMMWEVALKKDKLKLLDKLSEPMLGNPMFIEYNGNIVTQDICQTVIEVNTIVETIDYDSESKLKVIELGAGHGRIGNLMLSAFPNIQYVIIDIPPALYVSQWYLSNLFPSKKIFKFREFVNYDEIREEFESSSIAFLAPQQIELIKDKYFDLFINVCSLMEMKPIQIENWFKHIDRVCEGWFYTKQWYESKNQFDKVVILETDYPMRNNWDKILNRTSIHPLLFESIYKIN